MTWGFVAVGAGMLGGAILSSNAAESAAETQAGAAKEAGTASLEGLQVQLAADKEVLLGHMATIRNVTNDPAIAMLANLVLERMTQGGRE